MGEGATFLGSFKYAASRFRVKFDQRSTRFIASTAPSAFSLREKVARSAG
jgi:hypothetical protein